MRKNNYERILRVAAKLINQRGFEGASLQKIADEVGLHKSSLFHYFKNKEELVLRIIEKSIDEVNLSLEEIANNQELSSEEKLKKAIDNHLILLIRYIYNVNIYLNELRNLSKKSQRTYLEKRRRYGKHFEKIIGEMQTKGFFSGLDTKIVTYGLLGMLNWVLKWYKRDGPLTIDEISNIFYRLIIKT